ncbi:PP2C family protein-serine/threonine phosphatase [Desulfosediminicola flagellatus]|uniref:PP2C family protein-serine/threonine phosphatase n=1 Tax=Desulfosediminicola flagellatus TaxID=2569541 RepID=UPI0010ACF091|nr:protein phosphatase 2C domain-containing protein [Desulfosediminicola flagellatus]
MMHNCFWYSCSGSRTVDNRDYCGLASGNGLSIYILADGFTNCRNGGPLAKDLIAAIIYKCQRESTDISIELVKKWLREIHREIRIKYISDSTAFIIAIFDSEGNLTTLHAGDCLIGRVVEESNIEWLAVPHTLANATSDVTLEKMVNNPNRNVLTRCFKGRRFRNPEEQSILIHSDDRIILATDGFWADLSSNKQIDLLKGKYSPHNQSDDVSFLLLEKCLEKNREIKSCSGNLIEGTGEQRSQLT